VAFDIGSANRIQAVGKRTRCAWARYDLLDAIKNSCLLRIPRSRMGVKPDCQWPAFCTEDRMTMLSVVESGTGTAPLVPPSKLRWEWRSFGRRFGGAEMRIAERSGSVPAESDETYFLSADGDNVKVRDALVDVKVLRDVNPAGLEQWAPEMKAPFPLSTVDVAKVMDALRVTPGAPLRGGYGLQELVELLEREGSGVRVVRVHKRRTRYKVEDCMAELSDIAANGKATRTMAVESENADAVVRAVEALGLRGYANMSYPRGLAMLIDDVPERYAAIDVGTNSVKFHIAERDLAGSWRTYADRAEVTRLGDGMATTKRIGEAALQRTIAAISDMATEAKAKDVRATVTVGTAAFRLAANASEALAAIRKHCGVQIKILSGDDEARLAYLATIAALDPATSAIVVFDTGGGSSQFTFGHGTSIDERFSVDVGAVRLTDRFNLDRAVSEQVVREAMAAISNDLARLDGRSTPDCLVGMGGAVTSITAVSLGLADYDPDLVQGAIVTAAEIDRQIALYRSLTAEDRRSITGLQPNRGAVILAGACIVRTILEKLGQDRLTVSDRGLRHGLIAERFGQS
jgi:exopolyphosphatase/guanosine-5'-triphosphate,3'-diphosphate pyrophosphatase